MAGVLYSRMPWLLSNVTDTVSKFGRIPDIDNGNTNEDVWDGTGAYGGFLAAAATMTVSSSSTADDGDPAGSGALTVSVVGLDADFLEVQQNITMNGQTGVTLATPLIRVYRAWVETAGAGLTNAGDIWIGTGTITTGVPAVRHAGILTGRGQTLMAIYTIPANFNHGLIISWYASTGANVTDAYASVALQTREFGKAWRTRRQMDVRGHMIEALESPIALRPKADIRVRVIDCGTNNARVSAGFDVALTGG